MNHYDMQGEGYEWSNIYALPPRGTPTGGGYFTVEDLLKFDHALRNHKLLTPNYTNFLLNRFEGSSEDQHIPSKIKKSAGAAVGICAFIGMDFNTDYSVIVLSNYDLPSANPVSALKYE